MPLLTNPPRTFPLSNPPLWFDEVARRQDSNAPFSPAEHERAEQWRDRLVRRLEAFIDRTLVAGVAKARSEFKKLEARLGTEQIYDLITKIKSTGWGTLRPIIAPRDDEGGSYSKDDDDGAYVRLKLKVISSTARKLQRMTLHSLRDAISVITEYTNIKPVYERLADDINTAFSVLARVDNLPLVKQQNKYKHVIHTANTRIMVQVQSDLARHWEWITPGNKKRAARALLALYGNRTTSHHLEQPASKKLAGMASTSFVTKDVLAKDLQKFGVPAVEIAGPWAANPKEWVRTHPDAMTSWGIRDFLEGLGQDGRDTHLIGAVDAERRNTGRRPSKERVGQLANALALSREKEMSGKHRDSYMLWAKWSEINGRARKPSSLPDDWTYLKPTEQDYQLLYRRTTKYGLCVMDAIEETARLIREEQKGIIIEEAHPMGNEMVFALIACLDPKERPTICGLDHEGVCPSEHWCTGVNNRVDTTAYEYFSVSHGDKRMRFMLDNIQWA